MVFKSRRLKDAKLRQRNRDFIKTIRNRCCLCGWDEHPEILEFHHVRDKFKDISRLFNSQYSIERIKEEINKCVILCPNCHRWHHHPHSQASVKTSELKQGRADTFG